MGDDAIVFFVNLKPGERIELIGRPQQLYQRGINSYFTILRQLGVKLVLQLAAPTLAVTWTV
jgi:hypothetical protein